MQYIQNQSNWCWATACMIVGRQYKKVSSEYNFSLSQSQRTCLDEIWQMAIVMNANTVAHGHVGNYPGDDEAKVRGLKYVVIGACDSSAINVVTICI